MPLGYKSETGSVLFSVGAFLFFLFFPIKIPLIVALPVFSVCSRIIARGSRCRVRPPNALSAEEERRASSFVLNSSMPVTERPVCIVTGTNSGIGFHTAVGLAAEGYEVVITCRSDTLTAEMAKKIEREAEKLRLAHPRNYSASPRRVMVVGKMPIECDNFDSIRAFVNWFKANYEDRNLQVLVNNAGMMRKELGFSAFNSQLELHTAVNFLGPLLLTELLLSLLERHNGRVVYVSSEAHRFPQSTLEKGMFSVWKKSDPNSKKGLVGGKLLKALQELNQGVEKCSGPLCKNQAGKAFIRYGTSKLLNTYHAHSIARRYRGAPDGKRVLACSLHPGCVITGFQRDLIRTRFFDIIFSVGSLLYLKTSEEGAQTSLHCAMCPIEELELVRPSGKGSRDSSLAVSPYFVECSEKTRAMLLGYGWDVDEAEKIVSWGKKIVGLS